MSTVRTTNSGECERVGSLLELSEYTRFSMSW